MNRAVTSREYKLMLKTRSFRDMKQGTSEFWTLLQGLIHLQGGEIDEQFGDSDEVRQRQTWYLDTPAFELRHVHGFVLRQRRDPKEYKLTWKYRNADRYLSASQDMAFAKNKAKQLKLKKKDIETKFEEDIIPPFMSKFSHSTSVEAKKPFVVETMRQLVALFPSLKALDIPGATKIAHVNDFTAHETVYRLGTISFGEKPVVKACVSFWHFANAEGLPLVAEFSFDYDTLEDQDDELEQFPLAVVECANRLFRSVQKQTEWVTFDATTKTAFAFEGFGESGA